MGDDSDSDNNNGDDDSVEYECKKQKIRHIVEKEAASKVQHPPPHKHTPT